MREEKFKVIQFTRDLIFKIDIELDNFPKKDIDIKIRIRNESYNLLEILYKANASKDNKYKSRLLDEAIAKIKLIDFLINLSYDKKLIPNKKYLKLGYIINDIGKYLVGWKKNIEQQKEKQ